MEKEKFEQATQIRREINELHNQKNFIEKNQERKADTCFNDMRKVAHWAICKLIDIKQKEFEEL